LRSARTTLIPALAVPTSLIGTFSLLYLFGYSVDNLSLMALTIATGFVVDDAILVIENITRHIEMGMQPMEAALKGAKEIGFTVVSITASLIAVFIPILMMGGIVGRLFREFAIALSIAIILSLFISLTLTPMMCARLLRPEHEAGHGRMYRLLEAGFDALLHAYERGLRVVLRHRFVTLLTMFGTMALTGYLYVEIPKGFFPQQDTGLIIAVPEAAQDISFAAMSQKMETVIGIILKDPAVATIGAQIGASGSSTLNDGRMFIALKPQSERRVSADQVIRRLDQSLAGVEGMAVYMQAAQDITIGARVSRTQYQYTLIDADGGELAHWAPIFLDKLKTIPGITDVASDQANAGPELDVTVKRDVASSYGILPSTIDNTLDDAFGQRIVSTMFTPLNQYHVVMEVGPRFQLSPLALSRIYVPSQTGQQVPLAQLVDSVVKLQPLIINHQGQFPSVTLSFNLAPGTSLGTAVAGIHQLERQLGKPASLATSFQGNAQAFQSALASTPILIVAAIVAVYLILGMLYESTIHPLTILSTLPSAGLGALLTLWIFGFGLDVIGLIGIILLIGIVKKNGIMMVDFALEAERHRGLSAEQSAMEACKVRFRPILMTTMCAMLGGVPLMIGTGTGSELRQPLGFAIVGGLIVSQLLTLFTTPVVYIYLQNASEWLAKRRAARRSSLPVAGAAT
jgi:HAE1 family hydrophobic/amphiphilic exporter-1